MTLQLDWPAEVVERVTREAEERGMTVDAYVLEAVSPASAPEDEDLRRRRIEEAVDHIRASRRGIRLGPDLTIRDLTEEGRRF